MGVQGLLKHILNNPSTREKIQLRQFAKAHLEKTGKEPELLCEFSSVVSWLLSHLDYALIENGVQSPYSLLYGGILKQYEDRVLSFIHVIKSLGLKVIFFLEGYPNSGGIGGSLYMDCESGDILHQAYSYDRLRLVRESANVLQVCCGQRELSEIGWRFRAGVVSHVTHVLELSGKTKMIYCQKETITEAVSYLRSNKNALGILSSDTNFAVVSGCGLFLLDLFGLDVRNPTAILPSLEPERDLNCEVIWNSWLYDSLDITGHQLADLAFLCGNKYTHFLDARSQLQYELHIADFSMSSISDWIRNQSTDLGSNTLLKKFLYDHPSYQSALTLSYKIYLEKQEWETSNKTQTSLLDVISDSCFLFPEMISVVVDSCYWRPILLEPEILNHPCFSNATLSIRMFIYALSGLSQVTEIGRIDNTSSRSLVQRIPLEVECAMEDGIQQIKLIQGFSKQEQLSILYYCITSTNTLEEPRDLRQLLSAATEEDQAIEEVDVSSDAILVISSLCFMRAVNGRLSPSPSISISDIEALLATILYSVADFASFSISEHPSSRAVTLGSWYSHLLDQMYWLASCLGLSRELPPPGKIFSVHLFVSFHLASCYEGRQDDESMPSSLSAQFKEVIGVYQEIWTMGPVLELRAEILNEHTPSLPKVVKMFRRVSEAVSTNETLLALVREIENLSCDTPVVSPAGGEEGSEFLLDLDESTITLTESSHSLDGETLSSTQECIANEEDYYFSSQSISQSGCEIWAELGLDLNDDVDKEREEEMLLWNDNELTEMSRNSISSTPLVRIESLNLDEEDEVTALVGEKVGEKADVQETVLSSESCEESLSLDPISESTATMVDASEKKELDGFPEDASDCKATRKHNKKKKKKRDKKGKVSEPELPIIEHRLKILDLVHNHTIIFIEGETGCGKSTKVPQFILDDALNQDPPAFCRILVTQPRRVAATKLAERVAAERKEEVGKTVGYCIAGSHHRAAETVVTYCTIGYFLQVLVHHPGAIQWYTHIILDEIHERSTDTDFALLIIRKLVSENKGIKVLIMSATMQGDLLVRYFEEVFHFSQVSSPYFVGAKRYPVQTYFLDELKSLRSTSLWHGKQDAFSSALSKAVSSIPQENLKAAMSALPKVTDITRSICTHVIISQCKLGESILVFLPGISEITQYFEALHSFFNGYKLANYFRVFILHSQVPLEDQKDAFLDPPSDMVHIILATNIAESSITLPKLRMIINFAIYHQLQYDCKKRISCLKKKWCSRASCSQRAGRAGRVFDGIAVHLITKKFYELILSPYDQPEIVNSSLSKLVLQAKLMGNKLGIPSPSKVLCKAIERPSLEQMDVALSDLANLGAIASSPGKMVSEEADITLIGNFCLSLPVDLSLSRLILFSLLFGIPFEGIVIAASLSLYQDVFSLPSRAITKNDSVFLQKLKSSTEARAYFDRGHYSDAVMVCNMFREWIEFRNVNLCVPGPSITSRRAMIRTFCRDHAVRYERLLQLQTSVAHLAGKVSAFLPCNHKIHTELLHLSSLTDYGNHRFHGDKKRFSKVEVHFCSGALAIKSLMAASFAEKMIIGRTEACSENKKIRTQSRQTLDMLRNSCLEPRNTMVMYHLPEPNLQSLLLLATSIFPHRQTSAFIYGKTGFITLLPKLGTNNHITSLMTQQARARGENVRGIVEEENSMWNPFMTEKSTLNKKISPDLVYLWQFGERKSSWTISGIKETFTRPHHPLDLNWNRITNEVDPVFLVNWRQPSRLMFDVNQGAENTYIGVAATMQVSMNKTHITARDITVLPNLGGDCSSLLLLLAFQPLNAYIKLLVDKSNGHIVGLKIENQVIPFNQSQFLTMHDLVRVNALRKSLSTVISSSYEDEALLPMEEVAAVHSLLECVLTRSPDSLFTKVMTEPEAGQPGCAKGRIEWIGIKYEMEGGSEEGSDYFLDQFEHPSLSTFSYYPRMNCKLLDGADVQDIPKDQLRVGNFFRSDESRASVVYFLRNKKLAQNVEFKLSPHAKSFTPPRKLAAALNNRDNRGNLQLPHNGANSSISSSDIPDSSLVLCEPLKCAGQSHSHSNVVESHSNDEHSHSHSDAVMSHSNSAQYHFHSGIVPSHSNDTLSHSHSNPSNLESEIETRNDLKFSYEHSPSCTNVASSQSSLDVQSKTVSLLGETEPSPSQHQKMVAYLGHRATDNFSFDISHVSSSFFPTCPGFGPVFTPFHGHFSPSMVSHISSEDTMKVIFQYYQPYIDPQTIATGINRLSQESLRKLLVMFTNNIKMCGALAARAAVDGSSSSFEENPLQLFQLAMRPWNEVLKSPSEILEPRSVEPPCAISLSDKEEEIDALLAEDFQVGVIRQGPFPSDSAMDDETGTYRAREGPGIDVVAQAIKGIVEEEEVLLPLMDRAHERFGVGLDVSHDLDKIEGCCEIMNGVESSSDNFTKEWGPLSQGLASDNLIKDTELSQELVSTPLPPCPSLHQRPNVPLPNILFPQDVHTEQPYDVNTHKTIPTSNDVHPCILQQSELMRTCSKSDIVQFNPCPNRPPISPTRPPEPVLRYACSSAYVQPRAYSLSVNVGVAAGEQWMGGKKSSGGRLRKMELKQFHARYQHPLWISNILCGPGKVDPVDVYSNLSPPSFDCTPNLSVKTSYVPPSGSIWAPPSPTARGVQKRRKRFSVHRDYKIKEALVVKFYSDFLGVCGSYNKNLLCSSVYRSFLCSLGVPYTHLDTLSSRFFDSGHFKTVSGDGGVCVVSLSSDRGVTRPGRAPAGQSTQDRRREVDGSIVSIDLQVSKPAITDVVAKLNPDGKDEHIRGSGVAKKKLDAVISTAAVTNDGMEKLGSDGKVKYSKNSGAAKMLDGCKGTGGTEVRGSSGNGGTGDIPPGFTSKVWDQGNGAPCEETPVHECYGDIPPGFTSEVQVQHHGNGAPCEETPVHGCHGDVPPGFNSKVGKGDPGEETPVHGCHGDVPPGFNSKVQHQGNGAPCEETPVHGCHGDVPPGFNSKVGNGAPCEETPVHGCHGDVPPGFNSKVQHQGNGAPCEEIPVHGCHGDVPPGFNSKVQHHGNGAPCEEIPPVPAVPGCHSSGSDTGTGFSTSKSETDASFSGLTLDICKILSSYGITVKKDVDLICESVLKVKSRSSLSDEADPSLPISKEPALLQDHHSADTSLVFPIKDHQDRLVEATSALVTTYRGDGECGSPDAQQNMVSCATVSDLSPDAASRISSLRDGVCALNEKHPLPVIMSQGWSPNAETHSLYVPTTPTSISLPDSITVPISTTTVPISVPVELLPDSITVPISTTTAVPVGILPDSISLEFTDEVYSTPIDSHSTPIVPPDSHSVFSSTLSSCGTVSGKVESSPHQLADDQEEESEITSSPHQLADNQEEVSEITSSPHQLADNQEEVSEITSSPHQLTDNQEEVSEITSSPHQLTDNQEEVSEITSSPHQLADDQEEVSEITSSPHQLTDNQEEVSEITSSPHQLTDNQEDVSEITSSPHQLTDNQEEVSEITSSPHRLTDNQEDVSEITSSPHQLTDNQEEVSEITSSPHQLTDNQEDVSEITSSPHQLADNQEDVSEITSSPHQLTDNQEDVSEITSSPHQLTDNQEDVSEITSSPHQLTDNQEDVSEITSSPHQLVDDQEDVSEITSSPHQLTDNQEDVSEITSSPHQLTDNQEEVSEITSSPHQLTDNQEEVSEITSSLHQEVVEMEFSPVNGSSVPVPELGTDQVGSHQQCTNSHPLNILNNAHPERDFPSTAIVVNNHSGTSLNNALPRSMLSPSISKSKKQDVTMFHCDEEKYPDLPETLDLKSKTLRDQLPFSSQEKKLGLCGKLWPELKMAGAFVRLSSLPPPVSRSPDAREGPDVPAGMCLSRDTSMSCSQLDLLRDEQIQPLGVSKKSPDYIASGGGGRCHYSNDATPSEFVKGAFLHELIGVESDDIAEEEDIKVGDLSVEDNLPTTIEASQVVQVRDKSIVNPCGVQEVAIAEMRDLSVVEESFQVVQDISDNKSTVAPSVHARSDEQVLPSGDGMPTSEGDEEYPTSNSISHRTKVSKSPDMEFYSAPTPQKSSKPKRSPPLAGPRKSSPPLDGSRKSSPLAGPHKSPPPLAVHLGRSRKKSCLNPKHFIEYCKDWLADGRTVSPFTLMKSYRYEFVCPYIPPNFFNDYLNIFQYSGDYRIKLRPKLAGSEDDKGVYPTPKDAGTLSCNNTSVSRSRKTCAEEDWERCAVREVARVLTENNRMMFLGKMVENRGLARFLDEHKTVNLNKHFFESKPEFEISSDDFIEKSDFDNFFVILTEEGVAMNSTGGVLGVEQRRSPTPGDVTGFKDCQPGHLPAAPSDRRAKNYDRHGWRRKRKWGENNRVCRDHSPEGDSKRKESNHFTTSDARAIEQPCSSNWRLRGQSDHPPHEEGSHDDARKCIGSGVQLNHPCPTDAERKKKKSSKKKKQKKGSGRHHDTGRTASGAHEDGGGRRSRYKVHPDTVYGSGLPFYCERPQSESEQN